MKLTSSSPEIVEMFDWACRKALSWAHEGGTVGPVDVDEYTPGGTGTGVYLPSYWAGYAHRTGFYIRDFVHQLTGAHLLGLDEANLVMLRCFAASATPEHGYYPVWAFNFDGSYLAIDYRGPDRFVREIPAVFELVEAAETAYRWTGDATYVHDPALRAFYLNTTGPFADTARGTGGGIFDGVATYNELSGEPLAEAGDTLATRYQAYLAMAGLGHESFARTAADLKRHFNQEWSGTGSGQDMVRGYTVDGRAVTGWGGENSVFMPLKDLIDAGPRNERYLDLVDAHGRADNIEAITYLPDVFFRHGRPDTAWKWMREIFAARDLPHVAGGRNGDYPEVSFTLVSQLVAGMLGIRPDAPRGTVEINPMLPTGVDWLEVHGIPVGRGRIAVRHEPGTTTLTNLSADVTYTWYGEQLAPGAVKALSQTG